MTASTRVRGIPFEEAVEITEARMALEGLVAARAAQRVTDAQARELDEIGQQMRRAVTAGELGRYSALNERLHALIRAAAQHRTADGLIAMMGGQLVRHQYPLTLLPGRPAVSLPQHERIIEAIRARSPEEAEQAMRAHLASVIDALRDLEAIGLA